MSTGNEPPAWHRALAYAVGGHDLPELGRQPTPDLDRLAADLGRLHPGGVDALRRTAAATRAARRPWPHPVPPELRVGIGFAQFEAALGALRTRLALDARPLARPAVDRMLDADERRLQADRPPHHGS